MGSNDRALVHTGYLTIFRRVEEFHIAGLAEAGYGGSHSHVAFRCNLILEGFNQGIQRRDGGGMNDGVHFKHPNGYRFLCYDEHDRFSLRR
jgi:hypothetical protein